MEKFSQILSETTPSCFKFINQRTVKVIGIFVAGVSDYTLSKSDVILAINSYRKRIHFYSSAPIRSEKFNFSALKMYDLVPYLYTLINLLLTKQNDLPFYHRYLPELKLTRFCHLPFEGEIDICEKPDLVVMCSSLPDAISGKLHYMCHVGRFSYCSEVVENLLSEMRFCNPHLFEKYNVILKVIGTYGTK